jgi:hypothetical protein
MTTSPPAAIIYYSKTTNGFYNSLVNATMPSDAVVITTETYNALLAAQSSGQVIQADGNGNPIAVTPTPLAPTPAQQAASAIAAGVVITSTGTSTVNGNYACDATTQTKLVGTIVYIGLKGSFPGGGATMAWFDMSDTPHIFPNVTVFEAFAEAICTYIAAVQEWALAGGIGTIPSNAVTIP